MLLKRKLIKAHMHSAEGYAECSYCNRLKVGAVLVKNDSIIGIGYNGRPSGEPNVCEIDPATTHPDVRHAEINALKKVTRSTESSAGSVMFVTHKPCRQCAIDMVDAGVAAVFYKNSYRDDTGIEYLAKKDVKVFQYTDQQQIFEYDPRYGWLFCPNEYDYIEV